MDEPKTDGGALPIAPAKEPADPELISVKRLLTLLDKTAKSSRTYGSANPVAQKFFQELFEGLTAHLATYSKLAFLIQRSELYFNGEVVYRSEQESSNESVAFKLYADGIRELAFLEGLAAEDLSFLLDSLWGSLDSEEDDDDIVTRLWSKDLSTITIVSAEEVAKASTGGTGGDVFALPTAGMMEAAESNLRDILDREQAKARKESGPGVYGSSPSGDKPTEKAGRFQSGHVGYEVSEKELAELAKEIEAESARDNMTYLLDILTAILASEKSPVILTKLFDLWGNVLDSLAAQGRWTVLDSVLGLLHAAAEVRPDLGDDHKIQLAAMLDNLGRPERMRLIETYLNKTPDATTEGLPAVLLAMTPAAVFATCTHGNRERPAIRRSRLGASRCSRKISRSCFAVLSDRRPREENLRDLKWNNPRFADS
jgi:hypothetical protein